MKGQNAMTRTLSVSKGNRKMGSIPSVSLPPVVTCKNCSTCKHKCYALKMCRIYPTVKKAYDNNLALLNEDRDAYFLQVKASAMVTKYFRFHVSGDIVDIDYLDRMCKLASELSDTRFLCFTKNYEDVEEYTKANEIPENLKLIISLPFDGSKVNNIGNLPTARVIMKGNEPDENDKVCGGNCAECACRGVGCWELKKGETIAFYEH